MHFLQIYVIYPSAIEQLELCDAFQVLKPTVKQCCTIDPVSSIVPTVSSAFASTIARVFSLQAPWPTNKLVNQKQNKNGFNCQVQ